MLITKVFRNEEEEIRTGISNLNDKNCANLLSYYVETSIRSHNRDEKEKIEGLEEKFLLELQGKGLKQFYKEIYIRKIKEKEYGEIIDLLFERDVWEPDSWNLNDAYDDTICNFINTYHYEGISDDLKIYLNKILDDVIEVNEEKVEEVKSEEMPF